MTSWREIPLTQGKVAIVDAADYDALVVHRWHYRITDPKNSKGYAVRSVGPAGAQRQFYMHNVIMGVDAEGRIDHIDLDGLNNRRENLRLTTLSMQMFHRVMPPKATGLPRGVERRGNRYRVRLWIDRKAVHVGNYSTVEEAVAAHEIACLKYRQEVAPSAAG